MSVIFLLHVEFGVKRQRALGEGEVFEGAEGIRSVVGLMGSLTMGLPARF
jgi:hypothetical protein